VIILETEKVTNDFAAPLFSWCDIQLDNQVSWMAYTFDFCIVNPDNTDTCVDVNDYIIFDTDTDRINIRFSDFDLISWDQNYGTNRAMDLRISYID
jgi:hypothetical protein